MSFMSLLPALISAGGSLAGGIMNSNAQARANQTNAILNYDQMNLQNEQYQRSQGFQENAFKQALITRAEDIQTQKDFAQLGIQWRAADARAAGLHPLAATGAQLPSFSPISVGAGSSVSPMSPSLHKMDPVTGIGDALGPMGQSIGEAVKATMSEDKAYDAALKAQNLRRGELENTKLASEIALMGAPGRRARSPGIPNRSSDRKLVISGQGDTLRLDLQPDKTTGEGRVEKTVNPEVGLLRGRDNTLIPTMAEEAQKRLQDDWWGKIMWGFRTHAAAARDTMGGRRSLVPGYGYNPLSGAYQKLWERDWKQPGDPGYVPGYKRGYK